MGTQVVRHTSRDYDVTLNFASTENNLSWSFEQEGDGEIYDVVLNNVSSYTVGGNSITLPYDVVNKTLYSASIVKSITGQIASITFKTRRSDNKTVSLNVPDYSVYDGRYLYCLLANNTIEKYDSQLLTASNYVGAGVWITNPYVSTISLPALSLTSWQAIHFCGSKILALANRANAVGTISLCYIDTETNAITNLQGNANSFTDISNSAYAFTGDVSGVAYSTQNLIICGAVNGCALIDLTAITFNYRGSGTSLFTLLGNSSFPKMATYIPVRDVFAMAGDLKGVDDYAVNYKSLSIRGCSYDSVNEYSVLQDQGNKVLFYDNLGKLKITRSITPFGGSVTNIKNISNDLFVCFSLSVLRLVQFSNASTNVSIDYSTIEGFETNMFFRDISMCSNIVCFKNNLTSSKIYIYDSVSKTYTGYISAGSNINSICSNQYVK